MLSKLSIQSRPVRAGFTLIELLVVLVILAAVAGLVIPKLGYVEEQAGHATAAAATSQAISNFETYKLSTGSYPMGLDTLTGTDDALYPNLWKHVGGTFSFGPGHYFEALTMDAALGTGHQGAQSFGHGFSVLSDGSYYFYEHSLTSTDPNNSATTRRTFNAAGPETFAFVKPYSAPVAGPPSDATFLSNVYKAAGYPTGTPTGTRLIAFGIGPNTSSIGSTMASAPTHNEQDSTKYGRFIAIFAINASGKSMQLKTVLDSQGVAVGQNVEDYRKSGPEND